MNLCLLLIAGFFTVSSGLTLQYHFVNESKNWTEAQRYCRETYGDLATVNNMDDMNQLLQSVNGSYNGSAWIGLYNVINPWRWSLDDRSPTNSTELTYTNWYQGRPLDGQCVWKLKYLYNYEWSDVGCNVLQYFICYNGSPGAAQPYVRIALFMNFTDAQSYCRQHYTDLASARDQNEDNMIANVMTSNHFYIGLYRTNTLTWSDQSSSTFRFWGAGQPHLYQGSPYCTATLISDSGKWTDDSCSNTRPFICHSVVRDRVLGLKVVLKSQRILSESEIGDMIVQKVRNVLVSTGLPNTISIGVRQIKGPRP